MNILHTLHLLASSRRQKKTRLTFRMCETHRRANILPSGNTKAVTYLSSLRGTLLLINSSLWIPAPSHFKNFADVEPKWPELRHCSAFPNMVIKWFSAHGRDFVRLRTGNRKRPLRTIQLLIYLLISCCIRLHIRRRKSQQSSIFYFLFIFVVSLKVKEIFAVVK